jgi:hypothetical protein
VDIQEDPVIKKLKPKAKNKVTMLHQSKSASMNVGVLVYEKLGKEI